MSAIVPQRDLKVETDFLISIRDLNFLLLQRDWTDKSHGDLDLLLSTCDWSLFIDRVLDFSHANQFPLAKVYEIEAYVICLVLLTPRNRLHLDVALSVPNRPFFGVATDRALQRRDYSGPFPLAHPDDAKTYTIENRRYKNSEVRKLLRKMRNSLTIYRRVHECTKCFKCGCFYIPLVENRDILRCSIVTQHNIVYLREKLRLRYARFK